MLNLLDKRERAELFRTRLEVALIQSGLSRAALARVTGVDRSTITQLLHKDDVRMPGSHLVACCAAALSVSADWLLGLSDLPEQAGALLASSLTMTIAEREKANAKLMEWHKEASGFKIRHVPATLPEMLKTRELIEWEFAPAVVRAPDEAIQAAEAWLDWMRGTQSDYEIALPIHHLESMAGGFGYYAGLSADVRRAQIDWFLEVYDQLYPTLRIFLYDAHRVFSAPVTVFGPKIAAIYLGQQYVVFRDRERVQNVTRHFDWLVRESMASARQVPALLLSMRDAIH
ncbi:MAG: transcriptional regulator with XRE-family HTH domain [Glaciecola sp.]|jgi:transcriptional regulator with XRE-family HTH domain